MFELHTWMTDNGYKARQMAEESGLEYELKPVNIREKEQFKPENPARSSGIWRKRPITACIRPTRSSRSRPNSGCSTARRSSRRWPSNTAFSGYVWARKCRGRRSITKA